MDAPRWRGLDVVRQAAQVRRRIGLVGQNAAVDEILSGRQNLVMFGRLYHLGRRQAQQRADELLEHFGLADTGRKPVKQYSGGMRRRLDLAASLILAPDVLFADEPTTGLDPRGRNEVWASIRALVRDGTTVVLTTQYLDEADQLADQICVIDAGRVIAEGSPDRLKSQIGGDRVDVVVRDPDQLAAAASVVSRAAGVEADGGSRRAARERAGPRPDVGDDRGPGRAGRGRHRPRGLRRAPPDARRGLHAAHRPPDRCVRAATAHDRRREGGSGMTAIDRVPHQPTAAWTACAGRSPTRS